MAFKFLLCSYVVSFTIRSQTLSKDPYVLMLQHIACTSIKHWLHFSFYPLHWYTHVPLEPLKNFSTFLCSLQFLKHHNALQILPLVICLELSPWHRNAFFHFFILPYAHMCYLILRSIKKPLQSASCSFVSPSSY